MVGKSVVHGAKHRKSAQKTLENREDRRKEMSGGHFNYAFYQLDNYEGQMEDAELNELLLDFRELLHDLEWYKSGDFCEDDYLESARNFKRKWLSGNRDERLKRIVTEECEKLKTELMKMIGEEG